MHNNVCKDPNQIMEGVSEVPNDVYVRASYIHNACGMICV